MYFASRLGQSESFPPSAPFFGSELFEESDDELDGAGDAPFFGSEVFGEIVGFGAGAFVITFAAIQTNFLFFLSHMSALPATFVVTPGFVQGPPNFAAANACDVTPKSSVMLIEIIANSAVCRRLRISMKEG